MLRNFKRKKPQTSHPETHQSEEFFYTVSRALTNQEMEPHRPHRIIKNIKDEIKRP